MAIGAVVTYVGYAILAAGVIYSLYMMNKGASDPQNMDPSTLDDFNITTADEGSAAPLIYGRRKITGNILWYGNLATEPIIEEVDAGKDTQQVITGYKYYLDVWQSLGQGKLSIIKTYIQGEEEEVTYSGKIFIDSENSTVESAAGMVTATNSHNVTYCTNPGPYANALMGLTTIFYRRLFLGENTTTVPTIHYVVERTMAAESPLSHADLTNGVNPATIIYNLLSREGASSADINVTSFEDSSDYWNSKDYGLNIIYKGRIKTRDAIKAVLGQVGGSFTQDDEGKFYLSALDESDTSVATFDYDNGDIRGFNFERPMYDVLYTDFIAKFIDADNDYTNRTVRAYNPALRDILGRRVEKSVSLEGMRNVDNASQRIWEIMKDSTYPAAVITYEAPLKFYAVKVGDVVTVNNSRFSMSDAKFRVLSKIIKKQTDNFLEFKLRQKTEELYDTNWDTVGGTSWVPPDYSPSEAYEVKIWQLPYNHITGIGTHYLLLVAATNSFDNGFAIYHSKTTSDYEFVRLSKWFSQYGTLDATYGITKEIDEESSITYTPYMEKPVFDTVTLYQAALMNRMALIDNELIGFGTVTLNEGGSITLSNCIRGMLGTTIASHNSGADIWLFDATKQENIFSTDDNTSNFKILPYTIHGMMDLADVSNNAKTPIAARKIPLDPIVYLYRVDTTNYIATVYGFYDDDSGAGMRKEDYMSTAGVTSGMLFYTHDGGTTYESSINAVISYEEAAVHNFVIYYEKNGVRTGTTSIYRPAIGSGTWGGDYEKLSSVDLFKIQYGVQNFLSLMDVNNAYIKNTLMMLNSMDDVDVATVIDAEYLQYNSVTGKFEGVDSTTLLSATTTTTTTTTSSTTTTTTT